MNICQPVYHPFSSKEAYDSLHEAFLTLLPIFEISSTEQDNTDLSLTLHFLLDKDFFPLLHLNYCPLESECILSFATYMNHNGVSSISSTLVPEQYTRLVIWYLSQYMDYQDLMAQRWNHNMSYGILSREGDVVHDIK